MARADLGAPCGQLLHALDLHKVLPIPHPFTFVVIAANTASTTAPTDFYILIGSWLAIVVSAGIAIWQYQVGKHYRQADQKQRALDAELERQRHEIELRRQDKQAKSGSWELVFTQIREVLTKLEEIESEVRQDGPRDRDTIDRNELGRMKRLLENLSDRCPDSLSDPLRAVASATADFQSVTVISDECATSEYAQAIAGIPAGDPLPEIKASTFGILAVRQYQKALALHDVIVRAWKAINSERGAE